MAITTDGRPARLARAAASARPLFELGRHHRGRALRRRHLLRPSDLRVGHRLERRVAMAQYRPVAHRRAPDRFLVGRLGAGRGFRQRRLRRRPGAQQLGQRGRGARTSLPGWHARLHRLGRWIAGRRGARGFRGGRPDPYGHAGGRRSSLASAAPADYAFDFLMRPAATADHAAGCPLRRRPRRAPPAAADDLAATQRPGTAAVDRAHLRRRAAGRHPAAARSRLPGVAGFDADWHGAGRRREARRRGFPGSQGRRAQGACRRRQGAQGSLLAAFLAAATLAIGCAAACAGAVAGGRHRDEQTEIRLFGTKYFW